MGQDQDVKCAHCPYSYPADQVQPRFPGGPAICVSCHEHWLAIVRNSR